MSNNNRPLRCRSCGKEIIFVKSQRGKSMPCDAEEIFYRIASGSRNKVVTKDGQVLSAEVGVDPAWADGIGYTPHWATCPDADRFRRRR